MFFHIGAPQQEELVPFAECYLDMETGCGVERKERRGWEVGGSPVSI